MSQLTCFHNHLFSAYYQWFLENEVRIHLFVDANKVTRSPVRDLGDSNGIVTLNISPNAIRNLHVTAETISFSCRVRGQHRDIVIDFPAVIGVCGFDQSRDILVDIAFKHFIEASTPMDSGAPSNDPPTPPKGRPVLKVVK